MVPNLKVTICFHIMVSFLNQETLEYVLRKLFILHTVFMFQPHFISNKNLSLARFSKHLISTCVVPQLPDWWSRKLICTLRANDKWPMILCCWSGNWGSSEKDDIFAKPPCWKSIGIPVLPGSPLTLVTSQQQNLVRTRTHRVQVSITSQHQRSICLGWSMPCGPSDQSLSFWVMVVCGGSTGATHVVHDECLSCDIKVMSHLSLV